MCSVTQLCPILCGPMAATHKAHLSMELSSQEYWSGCHFQLQSKALVMLYFLIWVVVTWLGSLSICILVHIVYLFKHNLKISSMNNFKNSVNKVEKRIS